MAKGDITTHEKHVFDHGFPDEGGNPMIKVFGKIVLDNYKTGGYALDLSALIPNLLKFTAEPVGGIVYVYDYANKKLMCYYADYDAGADGALIQVADNTDTSDPTVRYEATGC